MNSNNYNFIAPFYNALARVIFLNKINKSQFTFLHQLKGQSKILYVGGGTGIILNQLLELNPNSKITYLEKSSKMIRLTKKGSINSDRIEYKLGTEKDLTEENYDAIITNYFLDQFDKTNQQEVFNRINQKLKPGGKWLVCDFNPAVSWWQLLIEKTMFLFLKLSTKIQSGRIPDIKGLYKTDCFKIIAEDQFYGKFLFSCVYRKL